MPFEDIVLTASPDHLNWRPTPLLIVSIVDLHEENFNVVRVSDMLQLVVRYARFN